MLNTAYDEIKTLDPGATVWAANTVLMDLPDRETHFNAIADAVLATGQFDGFAIHTFYEDIERNVYSFEYMRDRLDHPQPGAPDHSAKPIAVTSISRLCTFGDLTLADQATLLRDSYACMANAGASQAMWFQATDPGPQCSGIPAGDDVGILETLYDLDGTTVIDFAAKPHLTEVMEEIGEYLEQP